MNKAVVQFISLAILIFLSYFVNGLHAQSGNFPENSLRLRAEADSFVIRDHDLSIGLDIIPAESFEGDARHLKTENSNANINLRIYDERTGISRFLGKRFHDKDFPRVDIALDSLSDTIRLGTVQFKPFAFGTPERGKAWGQIELYIPPDSDNSNWFGVLKSHPFEIKIIEPDSELERFSFIAPAKLQWADGPRLVYDSTSFDTVTVLIPPDYALTGQTRMGGLRMAGGLRISISGEGDTILPNLPYLPNGWPLPGLNLFIDGECTAKLTSKLYLSQSPPDLHLVMQFAGPYEVLWEKTYEPKLTLDEFRDLTPDEDENIDFRTCMVPLKLRLGEDKRLSFRKYDCAPYEFRIDKGSELGYSIFLNKTDVRCYDSYPLSPLTKLKDSPTCDSPVEVEFRIFQYKPERFKEKRDRSCGSSKTLWFSSCTLTSDTGTFVLEEKNEPRHHYPDRPSFFECEIPRDLRLTSDGKIEFDEDNMMRINIRRGYNSLPVLKIKIGDFPSKLISTCLTNPVAVMDPGIVGDSTIEVTIGITYCRQSENQDAEATRSFWSKSYTLSIGEKTDRSEETGTK